MISSAWSLYLTFSFYPSKLTQLSGTKILGDHGPRKVPLTLQKFWTQNFEPTNQPKNCVHQKIIIFFNHSLNDIQSRIK